MDNQETNFINNSGQGKNIKVDDIIANRFNWGAFLLTCIWGIFNKTYITLIILLICLLPKMIWFIIFLFLTIWFGIKGNTWAWQNKQWKSIEHFHSVQRKWAIAGIVPTITISVIGLLGIAFLKYDIYSLKHPKGDFSKIYIQTIKCKEEAKNAIDKINKKDVRCGELSEELARCFSKYLDVKSIKKNVLILNDSSIWNFYGQDAALYTRYALDLGYNYVRIDVNGKEKPNRDIDIIRIPFVTDNNGKLLSNKSIEKTLGGLILKEK